MHISNIGDYAKVFVYWFGLINTVWDLTFGLALLRTSCTIGGMLMGFYTLIEFAFSLLLWLGVTRENRVAIYTQITILAILVFNSTFITIVWLMLVMGILKEPTLDSLISMGIPEPILWLVGPIALFFPALGVSPGFIVNGLAFLTPFDSYNLYYHYFAAGPLTLILSTVLLIVIIIYWRWCE